MYTRPPPPPTAPPVITNFSNSGPMNHSVRFYELLDALKMEYDLSVQSTGHFDYNNKMMNSSEYENKIHQQVTEMVHIQKTILEIEKTFHKMKQEYEEEIARLKRGDEVSEDHRPILPSSTAGQIALAGIQNTSTSFNLIGGAEKRNSSISEESNPHRNVRMRENSNSNSNGAIGDIATAAMASTSSISNTSTSNSAYDWLVTYNPKVPRLLSINLLQSINFDGVVCCVRFSNSGNLLAASGNKLCAIYDTRTGQKLTSLPHDSVDGGDLYVRSLSFNPSDDLFATGSEDNFIRIWDMKQLKNSSLNSVKIPKLIQTLKGHAQDVYALQFLDDEKIVSGSGDQSLKLWNVINGKCLASENIKNTETTIEISKERERESGITSLCISNNQKLIVTGSLDRIVRVYEIISKINEEEVSLKLIKSFKGHSDSVYSVTFDSKDSSVISGSLDRTIRIWKLENDTEHDNNEHERDNTNINNEHDNINTNNEQIISGHRDFVLSVGVSSITSKSHPFIISGSKDRTVQLWDENGENHQLTLQGHKNSVISVAISPIGGVFATGSGDGRARIWSYTNKSE